MRGNRKNTAAPWSPLTGTLRVSVDLSTNRTTASGTCGGREKNLGVDGSTAHIGGKG